MIRYPILILVFPFRLLRFFLQLLISPFRKGEVLYLEFPSRFNDKRRTFLARFFQPSQETPFLLNILHTLYNVELIPGMKRIYVKISHPEYGWGEVENLYKAIRKLNASGYETHGYALDGDLKSLVLLSAFQKRYAAPYSEFHPILPSAEPFFFGGLAKKLGVEIESFQSGPYKSFAEMLNRSGFTKHARQNMSELLNSLRSNLKTFWDQNSEIDFDLLKTPILPAGLLLEKGFLHSVLDPEQFETRYAFLNFSQNEKDKPARIAKVSTIRHRKRISEFKIFPPRKERIVVLPMQGEISMGKELSREPKYGSVQYYNLIDTIREVRDDDKVGAVILEIDSPGGSAFASELLHSEIVKLTEKKPVIAYLMNVAASGGYYIASAAGKMVSSELCIAGSVGTVSIRPNLKKLYDKMGIKKERVGFYPGREIYSEYGPLSPASKSLMKKEIQRVEALFYQRVADSRKKTTKEVESVGGGRVFLSADFEKSGMIDSCGTLWESIRELQKSLPKRKWEVDYLAPLYSFRSAIIEMNPFSNFTKHLRLQENSDPLQMRSEIASMFHESSWFAGKLFPFA